MREEEADLVEMSVEEAFEASGGFGRYQIFRIIICGFIYSGHMVFIYSLPFFEQTSIGCSGGGYNNYESCPSEKPCDNNNISYKYKDSHVSIIHEFDLLCEHAFVGWLGTGYFLGYISISYFLADLSERFGRKWIIISELAISIVGSLIFLLPTLTPKNPWLFIFASILIGMGTTYAGPGNNLSLDAIRSANMNTSFATIYSMYAGMEIVIGLLMLIGYSWQTQIVMTIGWYILWSVVLLFMEDGPRYLIFKNKPEKAVKFFRRMAYWNKASEGLPENVLLVVPGLEKTRKHKSFFHIFKHKYTFVGFALLFPVAVVTALVYFGIVMDMAKIGGNISLNTILGGIFEIVAIFSYSALVRTKLFGRKWSLCLFSIIAGCGFILELIFHSFNTVTALIAVLVILRKFGITACFDIQDLIITEIFPSEVRSSVMGVYVIVGGIGSLTAPMIVQVIPQYTNIVFAAACFTVTLVACFVPETRGKILTDVFPSAKTKSIDTMSDNTTELVLLDNN